MFYQVNFGIQFKLSNLICLKIAKKSLSEVYILVN